MGGASAAGEGDASAAGLCRSRVAAAGEVGRGGDIGGRGMRRRRGWGH
jgi:hypothetical protein